MNDESPRPVNGQVYRDNFQRINWDKKPSNEPDKVLHWNELTHQYE